MRQSAFNDIFSDKFAGFVSRMWIDHCDETAGFYSKTDDYPTYLINNFKYLVTIIRI